MKSEVEKLLQQHPLLSDGGYGITKGYADKHAAWRAVLVTPTSIAEIERLCQWIDGNLSPQKSINRRHTSYGLKHIAEREIDYVSNGQFIVAALLCGYRMMPPPIWYNPAFNFSESSIKRADQRITRTEENFYTWRTPTATPTSTPAKATTAATVQDADIPLHESAYPWSKSRLMAKPTG